ncbi:hypothetical protein IWW36_000394 [Coemansia brasiliensis]|uniref:Homeobox domain-containing protein n=1 Tax=Coemansia brasiliensis TaxID=2650707 RepID=A0A9W8M2J1_9FUNG|nr:hypothetical protein IWW36_000394 [Coemansia brasiliensis]
MTLEQDISNFEASFASDSALNSNPELLGAITPKMSPDTLVMTQAAGLNGLYSTTEATGLSVPINASSELNSAIFNFQGLAMMGEGIPCTLGENAPGFGIINGNAQHSQEHTKLNGHLQGVLGISSAVSTPPASVSSPEFLGGSSDVATMGHSTLSQMTGLNYAQALQNMHAPLQQSMGTATFPEPSDALYSTPIMGSTQMPAEPLFSYADAGSSTSFMPHMVAAEQSMQMHAPSQQSLGHSSIPSLAHTPQMEQSLMIPDLLAMQPQVMPGPTTSLADSFNDVSLSGYNSAVSGLLPFGPVGTNHLAHLRPQRSLSISEPARARSSSPSLSRLATMPSLTGRPYAPRRNTSMHSNPSDTHGSNAQIRRIRSHTRTGSDIITGCIPGLNFTQGIANWNLAGSAESALASRATSIHGNPCAASIMPSLNALDGSASNGNSDDGHGACSGDEMDSEPQRTPAGRIPLTREQRRVFFRWLYQNAHDPKPKGSERDQLRAIGNMSRERFKTWFANARRRYFRITYVNGVQQYTINERFRVACKRADIQLD